MVQLGKAVIDVDALETVALKIHHASGAAFILGESLHEASDQIKANAAFALADAMEAARANLYWLLEVNVEAVDSGEDPRSVQISSIEAGDDNPVART
jgi:hypothetical protein